MTHSQSVIYRDLIQLIRFFEENPEEFRGVDAFRKLTVRYLCWLVHLMRIVSNFVP
jgi:hypothetical protein